MKRVLFLLCACACLAATAAISPKERAKFYDARLKNTTQQHKFSDLSKATVTPGPTGAPYKQFMDAAKKSLQDKKVNVGNLVNKRSPRRLSNDEIANKDYVCFLYAYTFDDDGNYIEGDPFYDGWGAKWLLDESDGIYFYGLYFDEEANTSYVPLDIDYSTGEVALPWGILLEEDSVIGTARNRTDIVWFKYLCSEDYFMDGIQNDCMGTLYEDGSIIFDDKYVYYSFKEERIIRNGVIQSTNVSETVKIYVETEILAANGLITYKKEKGSSYVKSPVVMFQNESSDTLYIGNLYNYGMPTIVFNIDENAKMHYNCAEVIDGTTYMFNPIWDVEDGWIAGGMGYFYAISDTTQKTWGFEGDVTPKAITWDYAAAYNGYYLEPGFINNTLTWIDDSMSFRIPMVPPPIVRGDVNIDGAIDIYDIITLIDHLRSGELYNAENFSTDAANVNQDDVIDWDDVTSLYDYLKTDAWPE